MTVEILFDQSESSASDFTEDITMLLDLSNRAESVIKREWSETTTSERESNLQYSVAKRKKEFLTVSGSFYFNGTDKSQGTLQTAVNNGDIDLGDFVNDDRLISHIIQDVDTANDTLTVLGDQRRRTDLDSTIVVFNSTGNDGIYNPTSVTYDSNNNETTITVSEDVTDATVDGNISTGIHEVNEQLAWLEDFIYQNIGAPQHVLKTPRYNSERIQFSAEKGKICVIEEVNTPQQAGFTTATYTITLRAGRPV